MDFALNDRRRRGATGARLLAAFGLRRFAAGYAGPLVRLRRASDNAERDFSAGAGMWLDEAAVLAWCGASSAYASVLWTDPAGIKLLWYGLGMIIAGVLWIRRIVKIRV